MSAYFPTLAQFKQCFSLCKNPEQWHTALQKVLPEFGIVTKNQVLCFLAQTAHESGQFNVVLENLNYSKDDLLKIFPKHFTIALAAQYARQPIKIANRVYANRMGNGDESTGDGFRFRGRGIVQCTGKSNYQACSQLLFGDDRLLTNPDLLLEPENAIRSAGWYWNARNLNPIAEKLDMTTLTKKINGGSNGLNDRIANLTKLENATK